MLKLRGDVVVLDEMWCDEIVKGCVGGNSLLSGEKPGCAESAIFLAMMLRQNTRHFSAYVGWNSGYLAADRPANSTICI